MLCEFYSLYLAAATSPWAALLRAAQSYLGCIAPSGASPSPLHGPTVPVSHVTYSCLSLEEAVLETWQGAAPAHALDRRAALTWQQRALESSRHRGFVLLAFSGPWRTDSAAGNRRAALEKSFLTDRFRIRLVHDPLEPLPAFLLRGRCCSG